MERWHRRRALRAPSLYTKSIISSDLNEVLLWSPDGTMVIAEGLGPRNPMAQVRRARGGTHVHAPSVTPPRLVRCPPGPKRSATEADVLTISNGMRG
jgi:hypothetical protein